MMTETQTRRFAMCALVLSMMLLAPACAPRGSTGGYDRDTITSEEMADLQDRTLRQAIERLRPQWLVLRRGRTLSSTQPPPIVVYLNESRMSDETLDRMFAAEVLQLHFVNAVDATQRYGTGHGSGAILITAR